WGDSSTSAGTISVSGGVFTVKGDHTYAATGSYTVTTGVTHEALTSSTTSTATVTNTVYVNAAYTGSNFGDSEGSNGGTLLTFGVNAFATVQDGVNAIHSGGTVQVAAGTYAENVTINKALSLIGPNAGIAGSGVRGAEAVVQTHGNNSAVIT